ncbi:MAG TPA: PIG-L family deacetylase [Candidatus Paceibacterota bacterium]|nr:PIG-L family deacetylase [Candidatus Paceibacterota bacterium]
MVIHILKTAASQNLIKILIGLFSLLFLFGIVNYILIGRKLENWPILIQILKPENQIEEPTASDRVLIIAPHPDDETLGMGGYIQRAKEKGAQVKVIYLTLGDHNELAAWIDRKNALLTPLQYRNLGKKRAQEATNGTNILGLKSTDLYFLGYPDGGTLRIWQGYWNGRSFLNTITATNKVPYDIAQTLGASYNAKSIMSDMLKIVDVYQPTKVFLPTDLDVHPDHQAAALFAHAAVNTLTVAPKMYSYLIHQHYYPDPLRYSPYSYLVPPSYIGEDYFTYKNFNLTTEEETTKEKALEQYTTQLRSSLTLKSFIRQNEIFFQIKDTSSYYTNPNWSESSNGDITDIETPTNLPTNYALGYLGKGFHIKSFSVVNNKNDINLLFRIGFTGKIAVGSRLYLYFYPQYVNLSFNDTPKYLIVINNNLKKSVRVIDLTSANKQYFDLAFDLKGQNIEFKFPKTNLPVNNLLGAFTAFKGYLEKVRLYVTPWQWHNL